MSIDSKPKTMKDKFKVMQKAKWSLQINKKLFQEFGIQNSRRWVELSKCSLFKRKKYKCLLMELRFHFHKFFFILLNPSFHGKDTFAGVVATVICCSFIQIYSKLFSVLLTESWYTTAHSAHPHSCSCCSACKFNFHIKFRGNCICYINFLRKKEF